ncbi:putative polyphosphate/ATP-dependent NAD kinase [Curtobacterium pusillum]|uniref:Polyphosphate/ATP-dependent NAD kinase n=2 Tax=Curtobacterium pusillum TaxID=69373 RepID=A0AAW3TAB6_9MICO|nr:putative polyphosphate/ATP-dependent NAD kinase [Curtobacterium pusillum]
MTIGVLVNPVAGIGGPAGLGGSDGADVQQRARQRGGRARAGERAALALRTLAAAHPDAELLTVAGAMGEDAARASGLHASVVAGAACTPDRGPGTTAADTTRAAAALARAGARLVLFAGGDGTARDVAAGLPADVPMLGIPAGVKMYSGCFAVGPSAAGTLAADWLDGAAATAPAEILDLDEDALRAGRPDPKLFAIREVPFVPGRTQARKASTPSSERDAVHRAARGVVARMRPDVRYLIGPGTTTTEVGRILGLELSPLGLDLVEDGRLLARDLSETDALAAVRGGAADAVITVIGGQGFLLGRGNQQLSADVVRALSENGSRPRIDVVATEQKLIDLGGRPLLVDTGDPVLDATLSGHVSVITGITTTSVYPVRAVADTAPISKGTQ